MVDYTAGRIPLLDENDRFPDRFAPPSVAAALTVIGAAVTTVEQAASSVAGSASTATNKAAEATNSASAAAGSASTASDAATVAGQHRTAAETARTESQSARDLAQQYRDQAQASTFGGTALGMTDLDTVTTPGVWFQTLAANATAARHYPTEATNTWSLDVRLVGAGAVLQIATPVGGAGAHRGRVVFVRRLGGGVWDAWRPIPTQRIDNTAGRAVYTWDDTVTPTPREQLVYYDSGWRILSTVAAPGLLNGWTGDARIRRCNAWDVELVLSSLTGGTAAGLLQLPVGWTPKRARNIEHRPLSDGGSPAWGTITAAGLVSLKNDVALNTTGVSIMFTTVDPAPTTLPGTADGTIPNA